MHIDRQKGEQTDENSENFRLPERVLRSSRGQLQVVVFNLKIAPCMHHDCGCSASDHSSPWALGDFPGFSGIE